MSDIFGSFSDYSFSSATDNFSVDVPTTSADTLADVSVNPDYNLSGTYSYGGDVTATMGSTNYYSPNIATPGVTTDFNAPTTIYSMDGYASAAGTGEGINANYYSPNIAGVTTDINSPTTAYSFNNGAGTNFYSSNLGEVTTGYYNPSTAYSFGTDASGVNAGINTQFGTATGFSVDTIADTSISRGITSGVGSDVISSATGGAAGFNIGGLLSGITGGGAPAINSILSNITRIASGGAGAQNIAGLISGISGLASSITGGQQQFDTNGNAVSGSAKPNINKDTTALTQIGVYTNPGFFGDQAMKNSNVAFNNAVNLCAAISGIAAMLRTNNSPPPNYVRTATNYILTVKEKEAIELKSLMLSSYGVVPQDILSTFFYILSAIEKVDDLIYIGQVTGIPELGDNRYVRNILGILEINSIYKVGYLANGVASIINKYAGIFSSVELTANPNMTTYGDIEQARTIALALGVLGPIMLSSASSLNGNVGILANAPNLSSSNIDRVVNSTINMAAGQAINLIGTALTNPSADIGQLAGQIGVNALKNVLNSTPLGGILSAFGIFGGIAGGPLLSQMGGLAIGNYMSELVTGKRIPTQRIANNPSLRPPSYAGKAFFGETPCALPAVDQLFCRKVGSFSEPTGGSGTDSFGMQNFASFGGVLNVASVVARMVTGSAVVPSPNSFYGQNVNTIISNVANILNVGTGASIEMRRSDNAIPMMIGLSAAIAGQSFSPFGSGTMSNGWKIASSAANEIQNINPGFLETCFTSL